MDGLLTAIAIDGKWLRGVADGQVKLFAAMLQEEKVMIAQHRIPDETTETTQVKALLDIVDLENAVVTADAAHAQRETAEYIRQDRRRRPGRGLRGHGEGQPAGAAAGHYGKVAADCGTEPGHIEIDYGHGRIVKRSIWVTDAEGIDFPYADQVYRIRRDTYDLDGTALTKEIVTASPASTRNAAPPAFSRISPAGNGVLKCDMRSHWVSEVTGMRVGNDRRLAPSECSTLVPAPGMRRW